MHINTKNKLYIYILYFILLRLNLFFLYIQTYFNQRLYFSVEFLSCVPTIFFLIDRLRCIPTALGASV